MSDDKVTMTDVERQKLDWVKWHLETYVGSGGMKGHILDQRDVGAYNMSMTLILKTRGRRSGEVRMVPLVYGFYAGEVVIVASKGGADVDPAWYLNVTAADEVEFQIASQAFRASWRVPQGEEREAVFAHMVNIFPPYGEYRKVAKREIPLVMLKRIEEIPVFQL
jgi:deazaflavin-dependent oxidoreductase (nitroreductase family)